MMTIVSHVRIKEQQEPAWDAAMRERLEAVKEQPGFVAVQFGIPADAMNERVIIGTWATRAGVLGMLARMLVFGLIGVFVVKAARDYDPKDAIGLDGALQKLAGASYGPWLLGVTAAGLVAYGVYCLADARYRRV